MEILIKTIPFQAVEIHSEQLKPEGNQWKILVGLTEINTKSRKPFHSGKLYSCPTVYTFSSSAAYSLNSEGNTV